MQLLMEIKREGSDQHPSSKNKEETSKATAEAIKKAKKMLRSSKTK